MNSSEIFKERLRQALKESASEVQEQARSHHRHIERTGRLERAIDDIYPSPFSTVVYIDDKKAKYGKWVHEGYQEFDIYPKRKKWLRWKTPQGYAFAKKVHHPGWAKDQFLYDAFKAKRDEIREIFEWYTERAVKDIATGLEQRNNRLFIKLK